MISATSLSIRLAVPPIGPAISLVPASLSCHSTLNENGHRPQCSRGQERTPHSRYGSDCRARRSRCAPALPSPRSFLHAGAFAWEHLAQFPVHIDMKKKEPCIRYRYPRLTEQADPFSKSVMQFCFPDVTAINTDELET